MGWEAEAAEAPGPRPGWAVLCFLLGARRGRTCREGLSWHVHLGCRHIASAVSFCIWFKILLCNRGLEVEPLLSAPPPGGQTEAGGRPLRAASARPGGEVEAEGEHPPHSRGLLPSQGSGHAAEALQVERQQE